MTTQAEHCEDPQATRARARIGMVLRDKWRLDSLLGLGGMAAVYAATHRNGMRVAVKILHADFRHDEEMQTRFLQEGYAANTIQHEGAVSVLDDDRAPDGSVFLVMELLDGETVEQRWESRGRRLPVAEVLSISNQLLAVLDAAHGKNIVHRDVKPENLFLTKSGALKVLDFGIARVLERQSTRALATRSGMVMGTPAFMAPEQARARWDEVDERTDLWAVGATMFTLLSGRHVHEAESSQEQLIASATTTAPPLSSVAPELPVEVRTIVDRALAFDRTLRWPNARAMQAVVREALDDVAGRPGAVPSGAESAIARRPPTAPATTFIGQAGTSATVWIAERDARLAQAERIRSKIDETTQRYEDSKKLAIKLQATLEAGSEERQSLEHWFHRRVGRRRAAVEQAKKDVRYHLVMLGRRAFADKVAFGSGLEATHAHIVTLERAREAAARDVTVHKLALRAYHAPSLRTGMVTLVFAIVLAFGLVAAPVVWRATRVVEPPRVQSPGSH